MKPHLRLSTAFLFMAWPFVALPGVTYGQYDQAPPVVKIGEGATIAAWPPPSELKADPRILDTLTKEIYIQEGDEFGVAGPKNTPLKPVPTNDWWTDVVMNGDGGLLWQLPLVPKISANYIEIRSIAGLRANSHGGGRETTGPMRIGGWNGQETPAKPGTTSNEALGKARASGWSDWMVTIRKTSSADASKTLDATMARCMPFVWFQITGMDPLITFDKSQPTYYDINGKELAAADLGTRDSLAIKVDDQYYGVYTAEGTTFHALNDGSVQVKLPADQRYFIVSALPGLEHLATFAKYAYAKPIKTTVNYRYDPKLPDGNAVHAQWVYEVQPLRAGADTVLQGWLAPHYRGTRNDLTFIPGADFDTPRGRLRCATAPATKGFAIDYPFSGVLSHLGAPAKTGLANEFDAEYIKALLQKYDAESDGVAGDTYFGAKRLVLHARAMHMAKEMGMTDTYQNLKAEIEASLADWFTYKDGEESHYFARNDRWGSLIGFNFVHDFNLGRFTDIHFHYGYYVLAYAYVAMDDPEFRDKYKEIAIELAKAYAEWDRQSKRYPWMRTFEPMVGHSYAGGSGSSGGNNQESSSESIQAWAGVFLLGEALRGNDSRAEEILAAGALGYAIETRAVLEYYQDYHGSPYSSHPLDYDNKPAEGTKRFPVWPDEFRNGRTIPGYPDLRALVYTNGIMGDSGNTFATYFGANPEYVYGIQWLPNAPHMLFLASDPKFALGQFATLMSYRDKHYSISWINGVMNAPKNIRNEWHKKGTEKNPDPRKFAVDNPWTGSDMKGLVQNLYKLNPAFVKDISHEGDPDRDNPFYDQNTKTWMIEFPADRPNEVVFPKAIWDADVIVAKYPHLVPPKTEAELDNYCLQRWVQKAFLPPNGPGVDWQKMAKDLDWNPTDYPETPEGRKVSIAQLTSVLEGVGGSWPLITLTFAGLADPELGIDVMAESRHRNNRFAEHTETGMFAYYYFYSLRGLGHPVTDQHLSIPSSLVFRDDKTGQYSYVVHNKSDRFEMVDVFADGKIIGQVLAAPGRVTTQRGTYAATDGFAAIGITPAAGMSSVPLTTDNVTLVFNKPVEVSTLGDRLQISGPGNLALQVQPAGNAPVATFKVIGNWVPGAQYSVTVPGGIADASKSMLTGKPVTFSFTMSKGEGCRLVSSVPANGTITANPSNRTIELVFNSKIDPATLTGVKISGPGDPQITVAPDARQGGSVMLTLSQSLKPADTYTLTVPAGVADVYGQKLDTPIAISFTTGQAESVLANYPTLINPAKLRRVGGSDDKSAPFEGGTRWEFNAVGDYVELSIKADKAGTYQLGATGKDYPSRGVIGLKVNDKKVEGEWKQFDSAIKTFDFGKIDLVEGDNKLRFEVTGVNPASQDKPWFVLKDLTFTPASK